MIYRNNFELKVSYKETLEFHKVLNIDNELSL